MKKVLYIYHTSAIGGGSYCLLNILKEIDRESIQPIVLLKETGPLVKEIEELGIEVSIFNGLYSVPYNANVLRPSRIVNILRLLIRYRHYIKTIKAIKPDIIYVNSMMLWPFLLVKRWVSCKTILHIREHWPSNEHTIQRNIAEKTIAKYADRIIAINQYSSKMFPSLERKAVVVYDWINLEGRDHFYSMDEIFGEETEELSIFLFTGGFVPIKGLYEVLKAFHKIEQPDIRLLIMANQPILPKMGWIRKLFGGNGMAQYINNVNSLIESDSRVRVIPNTYQIKQLLEKSSCYISSFTIPHANLALAESIIAGTPAIAADTEEAREYSMNGHGALLFEINNLDFLENSINVFLANKDKIQNEAKCCSPILKELFSPVNNSNKLNAIYKTL